jgi:Domain of unknown function (DUF4282)
MSDYTPPEQPAAAPQPEPAEPTPSLQAFFAALFDVRFSRYVTPSVVTVLYVLGMVAIALAYISYVILAFNSSIGFGLFTLIVGVVFALLALVWLRVTLEFYLALVRLSGDFREWRQEWRLRS